MQPFPQFKCLRFLMCMNNTALFSLTVGSAGSLTRSSFEQLYLNLILYKHFCREIATQSTFNLRWIAWARPLASLIYSIYNWVWKYTLYMTFCWICVNRVFYHLFFLRINRLSGVKVQWLLVLSVSKVY